jgi:hypothetical protein
MSTPNEAVTPDVNYRESPFGLAVVRLDCPQKSPIAETNGFPKVTTTPSYAAINSLPASLLPCASEHIPDIDYKEDPSSGTCVFYPITLKGHQWFGEHRPGQSQITLLGEDAEAAFLAGQKDPLYSLMAVIDNAGLVCGPGHR